MGVGIDAYQIPKYHFDSSLVLKNPSTKVLFSLRIVEFPAIITLEELGVKQDFDGVELDNCNDVNTRSKMVIL